MTSLCHISYILFFVSNFKRMDDGMSFLQNVPVNVQCKHLHFYYPMLYALLLVSNIEINLLW
jgi:hypothetical protein